MKFLKFGAQWCSTCKTVGASIKNAWSDDLKGMITEIDIDKDIESAKKYGIRSIPTMVVVSESGEEVARYSGSKITQEVLRSHM